MEPKIEKQLEGLLEKLGKQLASATETYGEMRAVLAAEPTPGQQVNRLFKTWSEVWSTKYSNDKYVYGNNLAIASGFRRLLKGMDIEEVERRMLAFLESREQFYSAARHPVEMFIKAINKFGAPSDDETFLTAPAIGCTHLPRCHSDQIHTKRRQAELRDGPAPTLRKSRV